MIKFLLLHTETALISLLLKIFNQFFGLNFEKIVLYKKYDFNSIYKVYLMVISGVARGGQGGGQLPPGAARRGGAKILSKIF